MNAPGEPCRHPHSARREPSQVGHLGPGLITGASDDDPSGIATYSQAGATCGFSLLWTMLFSFPLMCGIQEISARIGRVTGRGIAGNIRRHYSPWLLYPVVFVLVVANTLNLGADIGAMGAALQLLIGGSALLYAVGFALLCLVLEVFTSYQRYSRILKWMTLVLFSYVLTVFFVEVPWGQVAVGTFIPSFAGGHDDWGVIIAILGTTISPYLFFWQASQEIEEIRDHPLEGALRWKPWQARIQFGRIRFDTIAGMLLSNLVAFFIILAAGATLHVHGITDIQTADQAAEALRPLAGRFASTLFALGIIGTGLLAVPVLAGSAAYAFGEALRWPTGLDRKPLHAKGFYSVLVAATGLGLGLNLMRSSGSIHPPISGERASGWPLSGGSSTGMADGSGRKESPVGERPSSSSFRGPLEPDRRGWSTSGFRRLRLGYPATTPSVFLRPGSSARPWDIELLADLGEAQFGDPKRIDQRLHGLVLECSKWRMVISCRDTRRSGGVLGSTS